MCLYPKLINNRKYQRNKKNGGNVPIATDERVKTIAAGCGKCMECVKQRGRAWSVRLQEEIRTEKNGKFITLTFSNESITKLKSEIKHLDGYDLDNEIATLATRRFLERWRKEFKISVRHWFITELGHNGTENIHIHGILWTNETVETVTRIWKYGFMWPRKEKGWKGNYVSNRTVNYIIKYATKVDELHTGYRGKILTSPGIGGKYINRTDAKNNKYNNKETNETYTTRQGTKINLPTYWRNKIYTDEQREQLWIQKLDKEERWVNGIKVSTKDNAKQYYKVLEEARAKNKRLGYENDEENWEKERYERERRKLNMKKRTKKFGDME